MPGAFDDVKGLPGTQSGRQPEMARSYEPSWRDDISTGWRSILAKLGAVSPDGRMSPSEERLVGGISGSTGLTGRLGDTPSIPMVDGASILAGLASGGAPGLAASVAPGVADLVSGLRRDDDNMAASGAAQTLLAAPGLYGIGRGIGKVTTPQNPSYLLDDAVPETFRIPDDVASHMGRVIDEGPEAAAYGRAAPSIKPSLSGAFDDAADDYAMRPGLNSSYGYLSKDGVAKFDNPDVPIQGYRTTDFSGPYAQGSPLMADASEMKRLGRERSGSSFDMRPASGAEPLTDLPGVASLPGVEKLAGPQGISLDYADVLRRLPRPARLNSGAAAGLGLGAFTTNDEEK
jgi:hypothetical protein